MSLAGRLAARHALALAIAALAVPGSGTRPAAADEGESALSVGLAFASFVIPDHDGQGGALAVEYERGLSRAFWLRLSAAGAVYQGTIYAGHALVGLTYVVDVVKYVPYLHAGVGTVALGGGALDGEVHPVAEIGIGLDILARRGLSYGAFARLSSFLDHSAFLMAGLRLTWRWGFF